MSEQNVKNEPGVGRIISKKTTTIDRATPNMIAYESRFVTIEQDIAAIDMSSKLDTDDFNGAEILSRLTTVDGPNSGLDADLLDGHEASFFAPNVHDHDSRYYTESESDTRFLGTTQQAADSVLFDGLPRANFALQASTYTKTEVDNLIDANGFTESLSVNGWTILPNGLIMQWGKIVQSPGSPTHNFPRIFTNECFNIQISEVGSNVMAVENYNTNSFTMNEIVGSTITFFYSAIGH